MGKQIKTMYVVHHSHTDIGYTALQERVLDGHADYIRTVLEWMKREENADFRWNCETCFCVEQFLGQASPEEEEEFWQLVREGKLGFSSNYLNFNDLADSNILDKKLKTLLQAAGAHGAEPKTAMFADVNGISMGQRDVMIKNGTEFLYMNIHCHHGMYPLFANQTAFRWENKEGQSLLVWNGEHYNLGNALGIQPNPGNNYMGETYFGKKEHISDAVTLLKENLDDYVKQCEENDYPYDFLIASVSGVFSDNAPPSIQILETIHAYQEKYPEGVRLQMVSLTELYELIRGKLTQVPVYRGDLPDWWANGIGTTPRTVKHYKDAERLYHLCGRLDGKVYQKYGELTDVAENNLLLYAEHTWGHSATVRNPYETMVSDLGIRKNSYASKAHEAASLMLNHLMKELGDSMRYYNLNGRLRVVNPSRTAGIKPVSFYIETGLKLDESVTNAATGEVLRTQVLDHPRGMMVSFMDRFEPGEAKEYLYEAKTAEEERMNTRKAYIGADRVKDVINDYDVVSCRLPYSYENKWFRLEYDQTEGRMTGFWDKTTGKSLMAEDTVPFFTPLYECTKIRKEEYVTDTFEARERQLLGRNIRGQHAVCTAGKLTDVRCTDRGKVFTQLRLTYDLPGSIGCYVFVKFFEDIPRIDYKLQLGKTLSLDIESVYMPLSIQLDHKTVYLKKGTEAFRPGLDQIPGSNMEYYMSDAGIAYVGLEKSICILNWDAPLIYFGEMRHHPVRLCDNQAENNDRPAYSWIMNSTWETNFTLELAGFGEFCYTLYMTEQTDAEAVMEEMEEMQYLPFSLLTEGY